MRRSLCQPPAVVAAAIITAARGAAKEGGPGLDERRRAHDLHALAVSDDGYWGALHAAIDAAAPRGMSEVFSDIDQAGEARAAWRRMEARRQVISDEQESRRMAAEIARRPGMAERVAGLLKRGAR